jgi:CBS domain-containing protein
MSKKVIALATAVHDVMTARVVAVPESAEYKEIVTLLRRHRVSAVPVIDPAGRVTGVVSEADLLLKQTAPAMPSGAVRLAWRLTSKSKASAATAVELMTSPAITIGPDASVGQAARLMQDRHIKRLPVVDAGGQLVGIVSRVDVLSVYERPDDEIHREITAGVIAGRFLLDPLAFEVTVKSGIVTMSGQADSRIVALNLLGAVHHVEGVVAVRDRLSYPAA